jgi:hypothetical protein
MILSGNRFFSFEKFWIMEADAFWKKRTKGKNEGLLNLIRS